MKREIKFRAWGGGKMIYQRPYDSKEGRMTSGDMLNKYEQIMQYTGLKDKNGKEIYEGDIVEIIMTDPYQPKVTSKYIIQWGSWSWMKGYKKDRPDYSFDAIEARSRSEIIGNIYENPELIKS